MDTDKPNRSLNPIKGLFWIALAVAAFAGGLWTFYGPVPGNSVVDAQTVLQQPDAQANAVAPDAVPQAAQSAAGASPDAGSTANLPPADGSDTDPAMADGVPAEADSTGQALPAAPTTGPEAEAAKSADPAAAGADKSAAEPSQDSTVDLKTGLFPPAAVAEAKATLCYFSFNTPSEFYRARIMASAMNKHSPIQISVKQLVTKGVDIEDAVMAALNSDLRCDGVVLSGHHTDEYYGERADGSIDIEDFEQLSYNPKYSGWFANVKALWLEGCNTAKFRIMAKKEDVDSDEYISQSPLKRMTALMELDDISGSIDDIIDVLNANLNEDNLVSGYLRIFPNATTFAWTNLAPGIKAGSDHSLPFHVAQLSHLINPAPSIYKNPMPAKLEPEVARHYSAALYAMLTRNPSTDAEVPGMTEKNFIKAWSRHGNYRYKWAFDNPSLRGFINLHDENNEIERQLRGLRAVQVAIDHGWIKDGDAPMQVADWLLKHETITPFATYTLQAMLSKAQRNDSKLYGKLLAAMRKNPVLQRSLERASQTEGYRVRDTQHMLGELQNRSQSRSADSKTQANSRS